MAYSKVVTPRIYVNYPQWIKQYSKFFINNPLYSYNISESSTWEYNSIEAEKHSITDFQYFNNFYNEKIINPISYDGDNATGLLFKYKVK